MSKKAAPVKMKIARRESMPPPAGKSEAAGYIPKRGSKKEVEQQVPAMSEDRAALYAEFRETQGLVTTTEDNNSETPPVVGETDVTPAEETVESTPETPEVPPAEETSTETETPGEPADKGEEKPEPDKTKTVPHAALHEEREKHKLTRSERDTFRAQTEELRNQNLQLLKSTKDLIDKVDTLSRTPKVDETPKPIDDPEAYIRKLEARVNQLEGRANTVEKVTEESRRKEMIQDLNTRIAATHTELEKEGYVGFSQFLDPVTAEIRRQITAEPGRANEIDTPANWKKVYKETVYPKMKSVFAPAAKAAVVEKKTELKKGAGLVGTTGATGKTEAPKKEGWDYNEYLAWQQKQRSA